MDILAVGTSPNNTTVWPPVTSAGHILAPVEGAIGTLYQQFALIRRLLPRPTEDEHDAAEVRRRLEILEFHFFGLLPETIA